MSVDAEVATESARLIHDDVIVDVDKSSSTVQCWPSLPDELPDESVPNSTSPSDLQRLSLQRGVVLSFSILVLLTFLLSVSWTSIAQHYLLQASLGSAAPSPIELPQQSDSVRPSSVSASTQRECTSAYPPAPRTIHVALVQHWRLCDLPHTYSPIIDRIHPSPVPVDPDTANLTQSELIAKGAAWPAPNSLPWPVAAYPRVIMLDPAGGRAWELLVYEAGYGDRPGYWTALLFGMTYNMETGAGHADVFRHSHPAIHPQLKWQLSEYLRCSDGAGGHMQTRAEIEVSWHWIKLYCPFAHHPTPPQQLLPWTTSGYRTSTTLTFSHPLFIPGSSTSEVQSALERRKSQLRVEAERQNVSMTAARMDWFEVDANSTDGSNVTSEGELHIPVCMGCVPLVSVSFCSAPLMNGAMLGDVRSHIAYHVALGVERFHLYDRFGLYEAVLNDYITSGIVDYRGLPLPHKSVLDPMKDRFPHGQHWDQNLALEVCHMRQLQTAEWFVYKDLDEYLSFPPDRSFVSTNHLAQCMTAQWVAHDPLVRNATGESSGLVVQLRPPQPVDATTVELYEYFQPATAAALRNRHLASPGSTYSTTIFPCPSPLLAYLTAVSDLRNLQVVTRAPSPDAPLSFQTADHLLPLLLPEWSTSVAGEWKGAGGDLQIRLRDVPRWMLQWVGLCEQTMVGPEEPAAGDGQSALMIDRWLLSWAHEALHGFQWNKWISKPNVEGGMWVHGHTNQRAVDESSGQMDGYGSFNKRPCDEIRYLHYKNFPKQRDSPPADKKDWQLIDDVHLLYRRLLTHAQSVSDS